MRMLKFRGDRLFDGFCFREDNSVLITNESGEIRKIVPAAEAGDDVQYFKGILSPGFINCHCHLELSHMKGLIPTGTGLTNFVITVVQHRHLPEPEILEAAERAETEMIESGIVGVGDICNNLLTIPQKSKGRIHYHNFIEASGYHPTIAEPRFRKSLEIYNEYNDIPGSKSSIAPHAPYSVTRELMELITSYPGNHLLTIHNQESEEENKWFRNKEGGFRELYAKMNIDTRFFEPSGKSSLQTWLPWIPGDKQLILVHNVHSSEADIIFAKDSGKRVHWCLCPNANEYISVQSPPVDLLIKHQQEIVLGTDSLASNHQLSILEEINTIRRQWPEIQPETLLRWATSNGAKALQMDRALGSFTPGKTPGILLIDEQLTTAKRIL